MGSRVTAIEEEVVAADDPAYKRKSFCDWVRTEVVTASEDEYEAFQGCFLSLHQNWLRDRKSANFMQQQQHRQQQLQYPLAQYPHYQAPTSTVTSASYSQPHFPTQWAASQPQWETGSLVKQLGPRPHTVPEVPVPEVQTTEPAATTPVTLPHHCDTYASVVKMQPTTTMPTTTQGGGSQNILNLSMEPTPSPLTETQDLSFSMFAPLEEDDADDPDED